MIYSEMLINNTDAAILTGLATFKFLSVSQLQVLTGKSQSYLRQKLATLRHRQFVKSYHVSITAKVRAENIFYLTPAGAAFLQSEKVFADIAVPLSGTVQVINDYEHRKASIDLFISAHLYMQQQGIEVLHFDTYYDKVGSTKDNNLAAKTLIVLSDGQRVIPDGVFVTQAGNGKKLLLVEMFCDDSRNISRVLQSIAQHARVLAQGVASVKYDVQDNAMILCAFYHEKMKNTIVNRLRENERFSRISPYFFFATLEDVKKDFGSAWADIEGKHLFLV